MGLSGMLGLYKMCFKNKLDLIKKKVLWGVMIYYLGCFWVILLAFSMKILIKNTHALCTYDKTQTFILLCDINILDLKISPTMATKQIFQIFFILGDNSMIKKQREDVKHNVPVIKVTAEINCLILNQEINC